MSAERRSVFEDVSKFYGEALGVNNVTLSLPPGIPTAERRTVVSCYSWPGVRPEACMEAYGSQVTPLLKTLHWYGGLPAIDASVSFHGRALWRGSLRHWLETTAQG